MQTISIWQLIFLLLISFSGFWIGYHLIEISNSSSVWVEMLPEILHYCLFWLLLIIFLRNKAVPLSRLLKDSNHHPGYKRLIFYSLMLYCLTTGIYFIVYWPITFIAPGVLEEWVLGHPDIFVFENQNSITKSISLAPTLLSIFLVTIIAPVTEEIFFRGLLFQVIAVKLNCQTAVVASSFLFAVLHGDIMGSFVFAVFMCWIYQRYNTLWAPIFCHVLNNILVVVYEFGVLILNNWSLPIMDIPAYKSNFLIGILLILGSGYWVWKVFSKSYKLKDIPYMENSE